MSDRQEIERWMRESRTWEGDDHLWRNRFDALAASLAESEAREQTLREAARRARSQAAAPDYDEEAIRDALWHVVDLALAAVPSPAADGRHTEEEIEHLIQRGRQRASPACRCRRRGGGVSGWGRLLCRWLGHDWRPVPLRYVGCWTCDEVCARCGGETWWPQ